MTTTKLRIPSLAARACALLLSLPAVLVACGGDDDDDVDPVGDLPDAASPDAEVTEVSCDGSESATVRMAGLQFAPAVVTINPGDVVMWTNDDTVAHTVTSGDPGDDDAGSLFASGALDPGDRFCARFDVIDDFSYFCELHPDLMDDGEVSVESRN